MLFTLWSKRRLWCLRMIGSQKGALEKGALAHLFWFKNEPFFIDIGCIAAAKQSFRLISNGGALVTYLGMQYSWVFYLLPCAIWRCSLFVLTAASMFILKMTCWGWYLPCLAKHGNFLTGVGGGTSCSSRRLHLTSALLPSLGPDNTTVATQFMIKIVAQNCRPKLSSPPMAQKALVATAENNRRTIFILKNNRRCIAH